MGCLLHVVDSFEVDEMQPPRKVGRFGVKMKVMISKEISLTSVRHTLVWVNIHMPDYSYILV